MRRFRLTLLLVTLLVFAVVPLASADSGCPPAFEPHPVADMPHGDHQHVGLAMEAVNKNGNDLICVKHVGRTGEIHVHIDDFLP